MKNRFGSRRTRGGSSSQGATASSAKRSESRIAEGVPLAMILKREIRPSPELVMLVNSRSISAERFRRLKTRLVHQYDPCVMVVTSGIPQEGKSTVSFNLALAFAGESGEKTLLVDADLRRPRIGPHLNPPPKLGLSELLTEQADTPHAILHIEGSSLDILPAGEMPPRDPIDLLASARTKRLFGELRDQYARIIIDSPPIIPFTDADVLGHISDGMILVTRAGFTPKGVYSQALECITSARVLGAVLNAASAGVIRGESSYDRYYRDYYDKERTRL